jgi:hypothetical protein
LILAAIDQFVKGARGIIHYMALLKAKVNELREANVTLNGGAERKNTTLAFREHDSSRGAGATRLEGNY